MINITVDWWAFGCLMYEMLTGQPPFYANTVQQMYSRIRVGAVDFPDWFDDDTIDLLKGVIVLFLSAYHSCSHIVILIQLSCFFYIVSFYSYWKEMLTSDS